MALCLEKPGQFELTIQIQILSEMKRFVLLALVVLATVYAEDEEATFTQVTKEWISRSPPPPRYRIRFYTDLQEANQNETYQFNLAIARVKKLREKSVTLHKVVWSNGKSLEKPKFNITWKTLDREEFKQWWEINKTGRDDQTKPFPNEDFQYAIVGDVNIDSVTCEDHHGGYELAVKGVNSYWPHRFRLKVRGCSKSG